MFEIFTETLEQIVTKSHKIIFLDGKDDEESKIGNFQVFFRKLADSQGLDKISRNCAFYGNSINRVFLHENSARSYGFHENAKIIENHSFLLFFLDFSLKILS